MSPHMVPSQHESDAVKKWLGAPDQHREWSSVYRTSETAGFYGAAFDYIAELFGDPTNSRVLDAGCGTAAHSLRLAERGYEVCAIDFSRAALSDAALAVENRDLATQIHLQRGDLTFLPYSDASFHRILCWGVLMHIPDVERAIDELARVTTPGGLLVVSEGNMHSVQALADQALRRSLRLGNAELRRTHTGIEHWVKREEGLHMKRWSDIDCLIKLMSERGFELESRRAGHFTEVFSRVPSSAVRKVIHAFNQLWFEKIRWAGPAFGNILVFRKFVSATPKEAA